MAHRRRGEVAQRVVVGALALATAEGDKVRANHDVEVAEHAETDARDRFHVAETETRERQRNEPPPEP